MNSFPNFQASETLHLLKQGWKKHLFLWQQPVLESALPLPDMQRVFGPPQASSAPLFLR